MLSSAPECDASTPGRTVTVLTWNPVVSAGEQRIDLTIFFNGFESGDFIGTPVLPSAQSTYRLLDLEPGLQYEWRVLTRVEGGWGSSSTATFRGMVCVVDGS